MPLVPDPTPDVPAELLFKTLSYLLTKANPLRDPFTGKLIGFRVPSREFNRLRAMMGMTPSDVRGGGTSW